MAVNNSLAKAQNTEIKVKYDTPNGEVILKPSTVRNTLVNGNGAITDQELTMFLSLCKYQKLNPFLREVYLIKYGNNPATMVVGKDVLLKRAMRSSKYEGMQAGVIVVGADGKLIEREGTFVLDTETLVGGWAKVFLNNYINPVYTSVSMKEYSTGKSNWLTKPATMIRKVAVAQALREAFPEETTAMYDASEMDKTIADTTGKEIVLDETPIPMPEEDTPTQNAVETPVQVVEAEKVITPSPSPATPTEAKSGGQGSIEEIMFGSQAAGLINEPPF
ncbi:MAG: phage recombination protein Bet [Ruminococcus sp.]|nr:phage recombination protein Bet [Ruminococcus sp.]